MPRRSDAPLSPSCATGSGGGTRAPRAACEPACTVATTASSAPCAAASARPPRTRAPAAQDRVVVVAVGDELARGRVVGHRPGRDGDVERLLLGPRERDDPLRI